MNIYTYGGEAFDKDGLPSRGVTGFVYAENEHKANGKAIDELERRFPKHMGWHLWFANVDVLPNHIIQAFARTHLKMRSSDE